MFGFWIRVEVVVVRFRPKSIVRSREAGVVEIVEDGFVAADIE